MIARLALSLFYLAAFTQMGWSDKDPSMEVQSAFRYLNQVRVAAGMMPFKWNPQLQQAAANHALYLTRNDIISHLEFSGKPYFTGVSPSDRALAQGYDIRNVTENHSRGDRDPLASVDGLMGAIYHRFGFLDFTRDEVGIGLVADENGFGFVYNLGNDRLNRYCRVAIKTDEGATYQNLCRNISAVSVEKVIELEQATIRENPAIVRWPPDQATNVQTVFYDEIPDPLPNLDLSGYPVSIQFNPVFYSQVKVDSFTLFRLNGEESSEVKPVHVMQKRNDPHQKFSDNDFALFPLNRLEWGTWYRAEVRYQHAELNHEVSWSFQTRQLPFPMFVIAAKGEALRMKPETTYAVYLPPQERFPYITKLSVEAPYIVQVNVEWEDRNTLRMRLSGQLCQPVRFFLDGNHSFSVSLAKTDNLNRAQRYPLKESESCH